MTTLQFAPWSSDLDISFYSTLASKKIDHDKLDDAARMVVGRYEVRQNDPAERSTRMQLHSGALRAEAVPPSQFRAEGMLRNVNTLEDYKKLDRASVMDQAARTIWDAIVDGSIYSCPSLLASFYAIFYADLKKYKFTYHFAFPALHSDPPWKINGNPRKLKPDESSLLSDAVHTWRYYTDSRQHGFFLAKKRRGIFETEDHEDFDAPRPERPESPVTPRAERLGYSWGVASIGAYEQGFFDNTEPEDRFVCFADPSTYELNPAWPLRNFLALVRHRWKLSELQVVCYRDSHARREKPHSLILDLSLPESPESPPESKKMPKVTGWERNDSGKLNSRLTDLSEYMDPTKLADQSVDLNLKLMKWRIAPELDLDTVRNTKCLLLGAGTLGSYVSRNLMGWGIRHITFIDNGRVSFSNPVRQPLFTFNDCTGGGVKKATRAAEALREIYPGVRSEGHAMTVPMAGHPVTDEIKSSQDFQKLKDLIDGHDVIFLLMDSRESRWLPTVMGKAAGKLVVNAALGFDSYVVMRHGSELVSGEDRKQTLGCYFCNDVVAPADSQKDLTLDQQCTVTRPGIAAIASALLVELVVSVLQHPQRAAASAPANKSADRSPSNHPLGLVPHQIRGFLAQFDNMLIQGPSYDCCSACSPKILDTYRTEGWEFVKKAMNDKGYVEELSGLAEVQRKAEEMARQMEAEMEEDDADGIDDINEEGELL